MTDDVTSDVPPLLAAARHAQEDRIVRVTAEQHERDEREIREIRERAVALASEILACETDPRDWTPHRDPSEGWRIPPLRGLLADLGGVTIFASRDKDRYRVELRPAGLDPDDGFLVTSRAALYNLADLPERLEEVERGLDELAAMTLTDDDPDPEPEPAPSNAETVDRLFSLEAARRAADGGDLVGAVLYLAGRVDLAVGLVSDLLPGPQAEPDTE